MTIKKKGRPKASEAGLFEEKILACATDLFMSQGYGRTSISQILSVSDCGKSAFYLRFGDKESLFSAVVQRSIRTLFTELGEAPKYGNLNDCLQQVGEKLAVGMLADRCIAFIRITAAEALNFPLLAQKAYQSSLTGSVDYVESAIKTFFEGRDDDHLREIAVRFCELVIQPLCFQAAFGCLPENSKEHICDHVSDVIVLLNAKGLINSL
ncbi:TetR/AcrR family transcriptional regulator [Pseudohongiella nitratireducens]|jgi:AcrR family transcriptional regulator|uniref:TetR/AcrR family transcriptional regulator n=1 Tax=Pseudohongiella nitratireducens TaxID=1768907 RepID=UPI0030EB57DE|tara:strand:- start:4779 stop:5408 length:630 start_codon:yes stop_codon:yes gene_type:complete